jgi:hypothetical protein
MSDRLSWAKPPEYAPSPPAREFARKHARLCNEKGQPSGVGLQILVEMFRI